MGCSICGVLHRPGNIWSMFYTQAETISPGMVVVMCCECVIISDEVINASPVSSVSLQLFIAKLMLNDITWMTEGVARLTRL